MRNTTHINKRNIACTSLHITNVCSMNVRKIRKFLLGELPAQPKPPDRPSKSDFELILFSTIHAIIVWR